MRKTRLEQRQGKGWARGGRGREAEAERDPGKEGVSPQAGPRLRKVLLELTM